MATRTWRKRRGYRCEALESPTLLTGTLVSNTTVTGNIAVAAQTNTYTFPAAVGDRSILSVGEGAGPSVRAAGLAKPRITDWPLRH